MIRPALALALALAGAMARAERILLIPLDSRPAAGQFAQMIARIAAVDMRMPPYGALGRFTRAGNPDTILTWLAHQDFSDVTAVIASTDMLAYGGLIASRVNDVPMEQALWRLRKFEEIRRQHPAVRFYAYSAIMRLAPTATRQSAPWRTYLERYAEVQDRYSRVKSPADFTTLKNLIRRIPSGEIDRYEATRQRDHAVQVELVHMIGRGTLDYLVLGQDDARPFGPHVPETQHLHEVVSGLGVDGKVYFCEGIDQHANVLLSRALLSQADWTPRIRVVFADDAARHRYAYYESRPIEQSLRDQIIASGARPVLSDNAYDYALYVNTPSRRPGPFKTFLDALGEELDQGFPVAVADINLAKDGTADPEFYQDLFQQGRMMRLLSFAGWNTAGNSLGTAIPAANVYLLARRIGTDPLARELAQREFLLHRLVNDYGFHKLTRPMAYQMIDEKLGASRDETGEPLFSDVQEFVRDDLALHLRHTYEEQFQGKRFYAGTRAYEVSDLTDVKIFLPWPRAYEVRLEFRLRARPMSGE